MNSYNNLLDSRFDNELTLLDTVNSLPWIGSNYYNSEQKLLIIGESHYHWIDGEENSKTDYDERFMTRGFINYNLTDKIENGHNRFMSNIERVLTWNDYPSNEDKLKLWTSVAFMNFSQRVMNNKEIDLSMKIFQKDGIIS